MMTRLRIKTSDGKLERITLPNNSTLRELKELIARDVLHNSGTTSVKLSLNNKVPEPRPGSGYLYPLDFVLKLVGFRWSLKAHQKTHCKQLASAAVISCGSWDLQTTRRLVHHLIDLANQTQTHLFLVLLQSPLNLLQLVKTQQYPLKRQPKYRVCRASRRMRCRFLNRLVASNCHFDSGAAGKVSAPMIVIPDICRMEKDQKPNPATQNYCSVCLIAVLKPHPGHTN